MAGRLLRCAFPLLLTGFLLSCQASPPAPTVDYSGCWAVYLQGSGTVCALNKDKSLTLWVQAGTPGSEILIALGGRRQPAVGREIQGGRQFKLILAKIASPLTIRLRQPKSAWSRPWTLLLQEPEEPEWFAKIQKLPREEARRELAERRRRAPPREQGIVLRTLWSLAQSEGNATKEEDYLTQGIAADRVVKNLKGEVDKATWLVRLYLDQGRFLEARHRLEELRLPPTAPAISKWQVAFNGGLLADQEGDSRSALELMQQAVNLAERVDLSDYRWNAAQTQARMLADLGRSSEDQFARLSADRHHEPCNLGSLLDNWGWSRLVAREGEEEAGDPTPLLQQALAVVDSKGCPQHQRLNVRLNLALSQQQDGRWDEARATLEQAKPLAAVATFRERLWWRDLDGRAAIAAGHGTQAIEIYDELEKLAESGISYEGQFRASLGRARAQLALGGQRTEALAALAQADRLIDVQSRHVPLDQGRDTLVALRGVATRLYLELLLEEKQIPQAFALARRDRARLLRQLAVRDRLAALPPGKRESWERSLSQYHQLRDEIDTDASEEWQHTETQKQRDRDRRAARHAQALESLDRAMAEAFGVPGDLGKEDLSSPAPGEIILTYHPLPAGQWVGFAAALGQETKISRFSLPQGQLPEPKSLARLLLEPFRNALEKATRVRVLPYGSLQSVDFHALPFGDEPLLAHRLVAYSLDLPARDLPLPTGQLSMLVVSDPLGNLPAARQEGDEIVRTFNASGRWAVQQLSSPKADTGKVQGALAKATLFHLAGHGVYAGFGGWESDLPLANGTRLTVGDVLAFTKVPRWVVLSACDAGRSSKEAPGEGIGIAQAFLLSGAQTVIAATRPVGDSSLRDLLHGMYLGWQPEEDLANRLQQAQLACRRRNPDSDWASLRVLTR